MSCFVKLRRATNPADIWVNADQVLYVGPHADGGSSIVFNAPTEDGFLVVRVQGDPESIASRLHRES